jgi:hypothetical protein
MWPKKTKKDLPVLTCECVCDGCDIGNHCGLKMNGCNHPTWDDVPAKLRKEKSERFRA